jgi:hypothetical protein
VLVENTEGTSLLLGSLRSPGKSFNVDLVYRGFKSRGAVAHEIPNKTAIDIGSKRSIGTATCVPGPAANHTALRIPSGPGVR